MINLCVLVRVSLTSRYIVTLFVEWVYYAFLNGQSMEVL